MTCQYGCPTENINTKCDRCGHLKKDHNVVHPHACNGPTKEGQQHVSESCNCTGFLYNREFWE